MQGNRKLLSKQQVLRLKQRTTIEHLWNNNQVLNNRFDDDHVNIDDDYCVVIVLYIDIYIALLTTQAKQKRFRCISALGKTQDLRRERDKEREVERIDEQRRGGKQFQSCRPINGKDLVFAVVVLTQGSKRSWRWEERRGWREEAVKQR